MARHKKVQFTEPTPVVCKPEVEKPVEEQVEPQPEQKPEPAKVKILSQREGHIIIKGGIILKHNMIIEVDVELAEMLVAMHPGQIRIL